MALVSVYSAKCETVSLVPLNVLKDTDHVTLVASLEATPLQLSCALPLHMACKSYLVGDARGTLCTIGYHRDGISFHEPHRGSLGSAATYWLVHPPPDGALILVQHLRAGATTSTHWHAREVEHFYPLLGASLIHVGSLVSTDQRKARKDFSLRLALEITPHAGVRIDPPHVHSLEAADGAPALNLLVIHRTRARSLPEVNHNHVEWVR